MRPTGRRKARPDDKLPRLLIVAERRITLSPIRPTRCGVKEPLPSARASAAAAPMASLDRPAAEPWLPVVVRVAAARRVQRLAATWELLRLAGAEVAATPLPAVCLFPRRRWQALSWSGPLRAQRRGHRNLKFNLIVSADC
jgi:hypothetical protein